MSKLQSEHQSLSCHLRMFTPRHSLSGFTLIELMVVVGILGVLLAIAVPSYKQHVAKSRRADAKATLLDLAAREERFFSTNNAYTNVAANLGYTALPLQIPSSTQQTYSITVTTASAI